MDELREALNFYLQHPTASLDAQHRFLTQECTYTDGSASCRTAEFFISLLEKKHAR
jgi:hypothetical protein